MTLSAGSVSLGVKSDTKGFGKKLADDISKEAKSSGLSAVGHGIGDILKAGIGAAMAKEIRPAPAILRAAQVEDSGPVTRVNVNLAAASVGGQGDPAFRMRTKRRHRLQAFTGQA